MMDFCFQPLEIAGLLLKWLLGHCAVQLSLLQFTLLKSTFETFSSKLRHAAAADDIVRPAARGFSSTLKSLGLSARLCAVETAFSAALRSFLEARVLLSQSARTASLMSAQLFAFAFPLARNFATGRLPPVPPRSLLAARHLRARLLLLATFC